MPTCALCSKAQVCMQRVDPFYSTKKPHTNGYLESLHRTYSPRDYLPRRDDGAFARALAFRQQEQQRYKTLERQNEEIKSRL